MPSVKKSLINQRFLRCGKKNIRCCSKEYSKRNGKLPNYEFFVLCRKGKIREISNESNPYVILHVMF